MKLETMKLSLHMLHVLVCGVSATLLVLACGVSATLLVLVCGATYKITTVQTFVQETFFALLWNII